jgi:hypothetical protein
MKKVEKWKDVAELVLNGDFWRGYVYRYTLYHTYYIA